MDFPYEPRVGQGRMVRDIARNQQRGGHLVVEAGTGTGKTICGLAGSVPALQDGKRLIYATRTNSQQAQVMREHQQLRSVTDPGLLVPFMGRRHSCPLLRERDEFADGTPEELGRLCRSAKAKALRAVSSGMPVEGSCPYYQKLLEDGPDPVEALLEQATDPAGLAAAVTSVGSCPYEALKQLLARASTVVVPYIYLIDDHLRQAMHEWMGAIPGEVHVIVDEAHNLPATIQAHHSPRLSIGSVERALKEAERVQDPVLGGTVLATSFLTSLHATIRELTIEYAGSRDDGILHRDALAENLLLRLGLPSPALQRIAQDMETYAEIVRAKQLERGKLPRSYLGAVAGFLSAWQATDDAPFVHLVNREPHPSLEIHLLDASTQSAWLLEAASTTHMSGTLAPLDDYAASVGLDPLAKCLRLHSPFAEENLVVAGVVGVRRSHAVIQDEPERLVQQIAEARRVLSTWKGRTGLWFSSHESLQTVLDEGLLDGMDIPVYAEQQSMPTDQLQRLVAEFRGDQSPRCLLLGVLGGRLTEGIDYPGDALQQLMVFGIPYPKPSARSDAAVRYHDSKTGDGWRTAVHHPVGRVLRQAIGRLIRGPNDTGVAVVLDERILRFCDHIEHLEMLEPGEPHRRPGEPISSRDFVPATSR